MRARWLTMRSHCQKRNRWAGLLKYAKQLKHYDDNHDNPDDIKDVSVHVVSPVTSISHTRTPGLQCCHAEGKCRVSDDSQ